MAELQTIRCCQCEVRFGMDDPTYQTLKKSSADFYCPFGHQQHFPAGQSEADKLRAELLAQQQATARAERAVAQEHRWRVQAEESQVHTERRLAAQRGVTTRLKNRVANGVCPCCNRTFVNLGRHMASQHKGFTAEEVAPQGENLH